MWGDALVFTCFSHENRWDSMNVTALSQAADQMTSWSMDFKFHHVSPTGQIRFDPPEA
jgi:hypothetical protein